MLEEAFITLNNLKTEPSFMLECFVSLDGKMTEILLRAKSKIYTNIGWII